MKYSYGYLIFESANKKKKEIFGLTFKVNTKFSQNDPFSFKRFYALEKTKTKLQRETYRGGLEFIIMGITPMGNPVLDCAIFETVKAKLISNETNFPFSLLLQHNRSTDNKEKMLFNEPIKVH